MIYFRNVFIMNVSFKTLFTLASIIVHIVLLLFGSCFLKEQIELD